MAIYPTGIPTNTNYPNRADDVDWIYAARYNEIKNEIIAICTELGISPSGGFATVVARLNAILADKIFEGNSSVEVIDTGADGNVQVKTENVLVGQFHPDGIVDLPKQSACLVGLVASDQAIPAAAPTKIEFEYESYDIQNEFDNVTNYRFTATKAGKYLIAAKFSMKAMVDQKQALIYIYKNGAEIVGSRFWTSLSPCTLDSPVSIIAALAVNDYIEIFAYNGDTVSRDLHSSLASTNLSISKLH